MNSPAKSPCRCAPWRVLAASAAVLLLAGCGGESSQPTGNAPGQAAVAVVTTPTSVPGGSTGTVSAVTPVPPSAPVAPVGLQPAGMMAGQENDEVESVYLQPLKKWSSRFRLR